MESWNKTAYPEQQVEQDSPEGASRGDVEHWLELSRQAPDPKAALEYAQRAAELRPDDPRVQETVQHGVLEELKRDPFVGFLAETDGNYVIRFRNSHPVSVPKGRAEPEVFPAPRTTEAERVLGMVWWMALGVLPAGIGALILSPFVTRRALNLLNRRDLAPREARLAWLALGLSALIGLLGAFFTLLLILRLVH